MKRKTLKFRKQEIADLTKEEQSSIVGGFDGSVGKYCTNTCGEAGCDPTDVCTGACLSLYRGYECDPASGAENATCYISMADMCHTDQNCTYGDCTEGCPHSYGDPTCNN